MPSYSDFTPRSQTARANQPGHRMMRSEAEIRRAARAQRFQQWIATGFIVLCLAVGGFLLIRSEMTDPRSPVVGPAADIPDSQPAMPADEPSADALSADASSVADEPIRRGDAQPPVRTESLLDDSPEEVTASAAAGSGAADSAAAPQGQAAQSPAAATEAPEAVEPAGSDGRMASGAGSVTTDASPAPTAAAPKVEVRQAQFSYGVQNGGPGPAVDYIQQSSLRNGAIHFYTVVEGRPGSELEHEWHRDGEVVDRQTFRLADAREVLVSSHAVPPQSYGTYRVYVRDASGNTLRIGSALFEAQ